MYSNTLGYGELMHGFVDIDWVGDAGGKLLYS
jgi:hypothetical protein